MMYIREGGLSTQVNPATRDDVGEGYMPSRLCPSPPPTITVRREAHYYVSTLAHLGFLWFSPLIYGRA
jgi:hypothetical protein